MNYFKESFLIKTKSYLNWTPNHLKLSFPLPNKKSLVSSTSSAKRRLHRNQTKEQTPLQYHGWNREQVDTRSRNIYQTKKTPNR